METVLVIFIDIIANAVTGSAAQIRNNLIRCGGLFFFLEVIYQSMSINIGKKTQLLRPLQIKLVIAVCVQYDMKIIDDMVAILLYHLNQLIDGVIQVRIFTASGLINIFDGDRIRQLIIGKKLTVAGINISPCRFNRSRLRNS